jgi:hypothetical protein
MKNFLIGAICILVLFIIILFNYSEKKYTYYCKEESLSENIDLSMELTEYRWWIFWGNSDGYMNVEIPNKKNDYFEKLEINGDNILIYKNNVIVGIFSRLTDYLYLESDYLSFDGKCVIK